MTTFVPSRRTAYLLGAFAAQAVTIAILGAVLLRGTILHLTFGFLATVALGVLCGIFAIIAILQQWRRKRATWFFILAIGFMMLAIGVGASYVGGHFLGNRDVRLAKAWASAAHPLLDEYKGEHGTYPATLAPITDRVGLPPHLLKYRGNGLQFVFDIRDMNRIGPSGWSYASNQPRWEYYD